MSDSEPNHIGSQKSAGVSAEAKRSRRNNPESSPESSPENLKRLKESTMEEMKSDLSKILKAINDVKASIKNEADDRKKEIAEIKALIETGKEEWKEEQKVIMDKQNLIEKRMNNMEKAQKKNNLILSNYKAKEGYGRKLVMEVETLLQEKTEEKVKVEAVQKFSSYAGDRLVVTMKDFEDKMIVLRKKKSMYTGDNGERTPIYVNDDLIREDQEIQKKARDQCKEARKLGKEAKIGYKKIYINGKEYRWDLERKEFSDKREQ